MRDPAPVSDATGYQFGIVDETIPGEEHLLAEFQAADRARFQAIDPTAHYHSVQIQDFLQSILADRAPLVTGEDGRAVVEMFSAIYESNKTKGPVNLPMRAGELN